MNILYSFKFSLFLLLFVLVVTVYRCEKLNELAKNNPAVIQELKKRQCKQIGRYTQIMDDISKDDENSNWCNQ